MKRFVGACVLVVCFCAGSAWAQEAELWLKFRLPVIDPAQVYDRTSLERMFAPLKLELKEFGRGEGDIAHTYVFFMEKKRPILELELSDGAKGKPIRQTFYYGEAKIDQKVIPLGASFEQTQKVVGRLDCTTVHPESIYSHDVICHAKGVSKNVLFFFDWPESARPKCKEYDCADVDASKVLLKIPKTPLSAVVLDLSR